jgi:hypothetical protein
MKDGTPDAVHQERISQPPSTTLEDLENSKTIVDTVHNDEALKVLAQYAGDTSWTEQEEKKLRHKIDRRLLSILCITYGLQYYDKAMLGQAVPTHPSADQEFLTDIPRLSLD